MQTVMAKASDRRRRMHRTTEVNVVEESPPESAKIGNPNDYD